MIMDAPVLARRALRALIVLAALAAPVVAAPPTPPVAPGIESKSYRWDKLTAEEAEALKLKGDPAKGRIAYEVCQGCHKPDGSGLADGAYPQLAGQHATVLIKQMGDIRVGRRDNPKMYPFAGKHMINVQEIADIATYLQQLPIPKDNGRGPGTALARGGELYRKDCVTCHGERGEGDAKKFYPVLAGQHYLYMVRQVKEIRDAKRRNANPRMVKSVKGYSDADIEAVSDYLSRLSAPPRR
jgi:cytochrome c553